MTPLAATPVPTPPELLDALLELQRRVETLEAALACSAVPVTGALGRLSAGEHAIARRVLAGLTNVQIAGDLHYSEKTVEWALAVRLAGDASRADLAAAS